MSPFRVFLNFLRLFQILDRLSAQKKLQIFSTSVDGTTEIRLYWSLSQNISICVKNYFFTSSEGNFVPKVTRKWNFWIKFIVYTYLEPFVFELKDSLLLLDRKVRGSLSENHSFTKGADSSEWLRVERSVNWREYWWQRDPHIWIICWVSLRPEVVLRILFFLFFVHVLGIQLQT